METALLNYFVYDTRVQSTCDFNPYILEKGIGIYEVLRVEQGIPIFLQEHIERLFSSAELEHIPLKLSAGHIRQSVKLLIEQNRIELGNIKFVYHCTGKGDNKFVAWIMPFFYPSDSQYTDGVMVGGMQAERENPNAKKVLYNLRKQADSLLKKEKLQEVIYVNYTGYITEGSRSNIFFVRGNELLTPEMSLVLPGITRAKVLQLAATKGMRVEETKIKLCDTEKFEACFLTGTSPKILPVLQLDSSVFDVQNAFMHSLMKGYDEMVKEDIRSFSW